MARFQPGEAVVAVMDIGGFARDFVPKGTPGVVIKSGWGELSVKFMVRGGIFSSDRPVHINVSEDEIR